MYTKSKSRIELNDTGLSVLLKMSDGNPGAMDVIAQMLKEGARIDPQSFLGGLGAVLALDTHRIYGPRIWMLYKDVCRAKEHFDRSIEKHGQASEISRSRYQRIEATFLTLVQRAVDIDSIATVGGFMSVTSKYMRKKNDK